MPVATPVAPQAAAKDGDIDRGIRLEVGLVPLYAIWIDTDHDEEEEEIDLFDNEIDPGVGVSVLVSYVLTGAESKGTLLNGIRYIYVESEQSTTGADVSMHVLGYELGFEGAFFESAPDIVLRAHAGLAAHGIDVESSDEIDWNTEASLGLGAAYGLGRYFSFYADGRFSIIGHPGESKAYTMMLETGFAGTVLF